MFYWVYLWIVQAFPLWYIYIANCSRNLQIFPVIIVCFSKQVLFDFATNVITYFSNIYYMVTLQVMWGFPHSTPVKHIPCTF